MASGCVVFKLIKRYDNLLITANHGGDNGPLEANTSELCRLCRSQRVSGVLMRVPNDLLTKILSKEGNRRNGGVTFGGTLLERRSEPKSAMELGKRSRRLGRLRVSFRTLDVRVTVPCQSAAINEYAEGKGRSKAVLLKSTYVYLFFSFYNV